METMTFSKIEPVDGFPGDYVRCGKCKAVVLQDESEAHKCPLTPEEQDIKGGRDHMKELWAKLGDDSVPVRDQIAAWEEHERIADVLYRHDLERIEKKYTPQIVHTLVFEALQKSLDFLQVYRAREYTKNDELRAKGVPYVERIKQLNTARIAWCDQHEAHLARVMRNFRVRPLKEWLGRSDLEWAREKGMRWIISFNLERIYYVPKDQNYG